MRQTLLPTNGPPHGPGHVHPAPRKDLNTPKERAEESEVAGRHKNSGQKDHKGARGASATGSQPNLRWIARSASTTGNRPAVRRGMQVPPDDEACSMVEALELQLEKRLRQAVT